MSGGPLGVLLAPSSYRRTDVTFIPEIGPIENTPLVDPTSLGHLHELGAVEGQPHTGAHYSDGIVQQTNGRCTYHLAQNVMDWEPGDTLAQQLTFVQRVKYPDAQMINHFQTYPMLGLSTMNRMLQYEPEWRKTYGDHLNCNAYLSDWAYYGVQQSEQVALNRDEGHFNDENNFIIDGRARVPNIWLAQNQASGCVSEGDTLYLLLRRHRYTGQEALHPMTWNREVLELSYGKKRKLYTVDAPSKRSRAVEPPRAVPAVDLDTDVPNGQEWDRLMEAQALATLSPDQDASDFQLSETFGKENRPTAPESGSYYWSWDPYVSKDRTPPSPWLWLGYANGDPYNNFTGCYKKIGVVTHVLRGNNNYNAEQHEKAVKALYPKARGRGYVQPFHELDCLEVMLGAGLNV